MLMKKCGHEVVDVSSFRGSYS